jgi:hypothetical protein
MDGINCTNCKHRIGNHCKALDQRLELLEVEKELKFKKPKKCKGGKER